MMTFAFCNSSMNTEVTPQPQPIGTESWTVGALEVSCCDHYRGYSAVSLSGSSEFLAPSLFEPRLAILVCLWHIPPGLSDWWCHWRLALTVSLYRSFGLPWFLLLARSSPYIRRLGIWHSSIRITCPTHRSWPLMMVVSMLVDLAWSRTSRLVMWSYFSYKIRNGQLCHM